MLDMPEQNQEGTLKLYIVSEHFKGQSMVNRHKLIYSKPR